MDGVSVVVAELRGDVGSVEMRRRNGSIGWVTFGIRRIIDAVVGSCVVAVVG